MGIVLRMEKQILEFRMSKKESIMQCWVTGVSRYFQGDETSFEALQLVMSDSD